MKQLMKLVVLYLAFILPGSVYAQTSGVLWIKTFSPASSDINHPQIDKKALATLDSLMQDQNIKVIFLGAADSLRWKMNGRYVHKAISKTWDVSLRLGRALSLRARYGRGIVGVTDENIAGVQVTWTKESNTTSLTKAFNQLQKQNEEFDRELEDLKTDMASMKSNHMSNGTIKVEIKKGLKFNWRLQAGLWTWQAGANRNILSPSLALSIITGKTSLEIRGGVSPWHISTSLGKQGESFVYTGIRYMKTDHLGFTLGVFRGWEYFTDTDSWSLRTTGAAFGIVLTHKFLEFNPSITYSNTNSLFEDPETQIGSTIAFNINMN